MTQIKRVMTKALDKMLKSSKKAMAENINIESNEASNTHNTISRNLFSLTDLYILKYERHATQTGITMTVIHVYSLRGGSLGNN